HVRHRVAGRAQQRFRDLRLARAGAAQDEGEHGRVSFTARTGAPECRAGRPWLSSRATMAPLDPLSLPSDAPGGAPAARLLFVCWGNICRSPTAEAVMRATLEREGLAHLVHVDSAGTSAEHAGDPPDPRSIAEAARRGLDLRPLRARQIEPSD